MKLLADSLSRLRMISVVGLAQNLPGTRKAGPKIRVTGKIGDPRNGGGGEEYGELRRSADET